MISRRRGLSRVAEQNLERLARDLERVQEQQPIDERAVTELSSDELFSGHLYKDDLGRQNGLFVFGRIVYAVPYAHWYRVQLGDADADFPCCRLSDTAVSPFSVRDTSPLPPGCRVLVYKPPGGSFGFIVGAIPDIVSDGSLVHPDWIVQGGGGGFKRELYYHGLFSLFADNGSVLDFSNNRPVDSSAVGEWGRISDLGGGIHIDPFLVFLRINEACGLFLHYLDDLARLEGYNLDIRTAVSEAMTRDDSGEGLIYLGESPYVWEASGALQPDKALHREISDEDVQYNKPYGKLEPIVDDQQPFYRREAYGGYLGQGGLRQVLLPPQVEKPDSGGFLRFQDQLTLPGVFREQIGLDGSYGLESAHSIVLAKRTLIPVAKRIQPPEAPLGDSLAADNYKFAGQFGDGEEHAVGDLEPADSDQESLVRASGVDDFLAHLFNWKSLHTFHYHKRDFYLPEQSEATPINIFHQVPDFSSLQRQAWLDPASSVELEVDHRYGKVDYFLRQASIALLPDGSTVWRGGGGEEIRFSGGSIQISCPGDIVLQPGRSLVSLAGDDIALTANRSLDLAANTGDLRVKAENNLEMLAANSGVGRLLLENKATGPLHEYERRVGEEVQGSGIQFKAANSQILGWASEVYLRTGGGDVSPGPIVLDADAGQQDVTTISRSFVRHLEQSAADYFPAQDGKQVSNVYTPYFTQFGTPGQFNGYLIVANGGMLVNGNIAVLSGHIGTELAADYNFYVGWLVDDSLSDARMSLAASLETVSAANAGGDEHYKVAVDERYYQEKGVGNSDLIEQVHFSFRNEEQYGTENWELPEVYWQAQARETEQNLPAWEDKPVAYQRDDEYLSPYPGYNKWRESSWLQMTLRLHESADGRDKDRTDDAYRDAKYAPWQRATMHGNYPVVQSYSSD